MLAPAESEDTRPAAPETPHMQNEPNLSEEPFPWEEHRGDKVDLDRTEGTAMEEELFGSPLDDTTIEELLDGMDDDQTEGNDHMVDAFILAGADRSEAIAHVKSIISSMQKTELTTFMEVFGGGAICSEANGPRRNLKIAGLNAFDLRTAKPDGPPWDFTKRVDRHLCRSMIDEQKPTWLVGSPPCTVFKLWNVAIKLP